MTANKKRSELFFTVSAVSMFLVSSGLIKAPFGGRNIGNPLSFLIAGAFFVITSVPISKMLFFLLSAQKNNMAVKIIYGFSAAVLLISVFYGFREYVIFVYDIILPHTPKIFICAVFAACVVFLALSDRIIILKFSLVSAVTASMIFLVFFIFSIKNFTNKNIFSGVDFNVFRLVKETGKYYLKMFLPALISIAFMSINIKSSPVNIATGAGWGFLLCLICISDSVLSFGYDLATRLDYTYIEDISTITVGSLFTRMDGFAYLAFFPAYLIRCALTLKLALIFSQRSGIKNN